MSFTIALALTLSACGSKNATQDATVTVNPAGDNKTDTATEVVDSTKDATASVNPAEDTKIDNAATEVIGPTKREINEDTDKLDLQMPTLSEEELLGTYDPNDVCIRLTDLIYRLGIEIDASKTEYTYIAKDDDGVYREHKWDVQDGDEALLNPPGTYDSYDVNQYDFSGKKVIDITMQSDSYGVGCTGISVYEYKSNGEIKAEYRYFYDEYEWDYILQIIYIYNDDLAVSSATFDPDTHMRTNIEIYAVDGLIPVKEIMCDENGNLEYYYTYEYNIHKDITKISKYNMSDVLENYVIRKYDDGHVIKAENYDPSGNLEEYTIYNWAEDFSYFNYETYDSSGNIIGSGRL